MDNYLDKQNIVTVRKTVEEELDLMEKSVKSLNIAAEKYKKPMQLDIPSEDPPLNRNASSWHLIGTPWRMPSNDEDKVWNEDPLNIEGMPSNENSTLSEVKSTPSKNKSTLSEVKSTPSKNKNTPSKNKNMPSKNKSTPSHPKVGHKAKTPKGSHSVNSPKVSISIPSNPLPGSSFHIYLNGKPRETVCKYGEQCRYGSECKYLHVKIKPKLCRFFNLGLCSHGDKCIYSHDPELFAKSTQDIDDLEKKKVDPKGPCVFFFSPSGCKKELNPESILVSDISLKKKLSDEELYEELYLSANMKPVKKITTHLNIPLSVLKKDFPERFKLEKFEAIWNSFFQMAKALRSMPTEPTITRTQYYTFDEKRWRSDFWVQYVGEEDEWLTLNIKLSNNGYLYDEHKNFKILEDDFYHHNRDGWCELDMNDDDLRKYFEFLMTFTLDYWVPKNKKKEVEPIISVIYNYNHRRVDVDVIIEELKQQVCLSFEPGYPETYCPGKNGYKKTK